jgi:hypothetical protein
MSSTPVNYDTSWRHGGFPTVACRVSRKNNDVRVVYQTDGVDQELYVDSIGDARRIAFDILRVTDDG